MAREGVPIKVKIGLKPNGKGAMWHDYPNWALLPMVQAGTTPESQQIVKWKYDKTSGHEDDTVDSPAGQQWGMMIVTEQFANEAIVMYPATVSKMTEVEAQAFWDNKAHAHIPEDRIDKAILENLNTELTLRKALAQDTTVLEGRIAKALDRNDTEPGVRKDKIKKFADAKTSLGFTIKKP